MWDCLVKLSTWVEGNSGQIQIVIGFVALIFAYKAYRKVIEQIDFSNKQMQLSIKQNGIEAKLNTLGLINENTKNNIEMLKKIHPLVRELEGIRQKLQAKGDMEKVKKIQANIDKLKSQKEIIEDSKNKLVNATSDFSKISYMAVDELNKNLNTLYENLVSSTNSVGEYDLMIHDAEMIKVEENLV